MKGMFPRDQPYGLFDRVLSEATQAGMLHPILQSVGIIVREVARLD
jgi:hypothetical protein